MRQGINCTSARLLSPGCAHEKRHPSKENPDQHPGSLVDHPWLIIKGGGVNFLLWDLQATKWSPFFNKSLQTPLTPTDRKIDGPESPFVQSKCNKMIWYNWWNEIVTQTLADWSSHSPQQKTVSVSLTQPSYTKWYVCGIAMHFATEGNLSVRTLTSSIDIFATHVWVLQPATKNIFARQSSGAAWPWYQNLFLDAVASQEEPFVTDWLTDSDIYLTRPWPAFGWRA